MGENSTEIDFLGHCYIDVVSLLAFADQVTQWFRLEPSKVCPPDMVGGEVQVQVQASKTEVFIFLLFNSLPVGSNG